MEFQTIKRNGNAVIPEAMFKLCGMGNTEKISMLKLNGGILLMPERVSTYQLLMLTDAMNMQSCEFLEAVAAECGTTEEPYEGKTLDDVLSEFQIAVPDWAREGAGISESVKLECRSDENTGSITVYPASYRHDITDLPRPVLQCFLDFGYSLYALNEHLMEESEDCADGE